MIEADALQCGHPISQQMNEGGQLHDLMPARKVITVTSCETDCRVP